MASTFDQMWDMSLAKAILGAYFVPDAQLRRVTDLVSHDGEGYLYFDGIRCENAGNGVDETSYLVDLTQKCRALESLCVTAMLSGFTVDQRHLLQPLAEACMTTSFSDYLNEPIGGGNLYYRCGHCK